MRDFVFGGGSTIDATKAIAAGARKACGAEGILHGFTDLTPADVEKIFRMCL